MSHVARRGGATAARLLARRRRLQHMLLPSLRCPPRPITPPVLPLALVLLPHRSVDQHPLVRREIVSELRNHRNLYTFDAVREEVAEELDEEQAGRRFLDYTAAMAVSGHFAGLPEFKAAAHCYKARITLFSLTQNSLTGASQCATALFEPESDALVLEGRDFALVHFGNHFDGARLKGPLARSVRQYQTAVAGS